MRGETFGQDISVYGVRPLCPGHGVGRARAHVWRCRLEPRKIEAVDVLQHGDATAGYTQARETSHAAGGWKMIVTQTGPMAYLPRAGSDIEARETILVPVPDHHDQEEVLVDPRGAA